MKQLLTIALTVLAFGMAVAQNDSVQNSLKVNKIIVNTTGDVTLSQGNVFKVDFDMDKQPFLSDWKMEDSVLYLNGTGDFYVTVEELKDLTVNATGDVVSEGVLKGENLSVSLCGTGDAKLNLDYKNVYAGANGIGDAILYGQCDALFAEVSGLGDVDARSMNVVLGLANMSGKGDVRFGRSSKYIAYYASGDASSNSLKRLYDQTTGTVCQQVSKVGFVQEEGVWKLNSCESNDEQIVEIIQHAAPFFVSVQEEKKSSQNYGNVFAHGNRGRNTQTRKTLLFNPRWSGVDMGLNMLLGPERISTDMNSAFLTLRPMRSWFFNFNIADIGVAFSYNHFAGVYTGIGLGWNNYSFSHAMRLEKGDSRLEPHWIDEDVEGEVRKSKLGVLYVQAPLMVEIRPMRHFFIAAGVTGGIRVDTWTKVKFEDKRTEKSHSDYYVDLLKLDATFRAGSDDFGFFASYNLLPLFVQPHAPMAHTLNIGFSLIF